MKRILVENLNEDLKNGKIISLKFFSSDPRFSRWKRRFGNRAEIDSSPSDEILPEVEDNIPLGRPYLLNNKIYPGIQQQEPVKEKVSGGSS